MDLNGKHQCTTIPCTVKPTTNQFRTPFVAVNILGSIWVA